MPAGLWPHTRNYLQVPDAVALLCFVFQQIGSSRPSGNGFLDLGRHNTGYAIVTTHWTQPSALMLDMFVQQTESTALWSLPKRNELTFILTQNIIFGAPYHGVVWRKTRLQSLNNKDIQIFRRSINSQRLSSGTKRWLPCLAPDVVNETTLPPRPVSQQQGKRVWVFWDLELTLLYPEYSEVDPKSGILKSGTLSFNRK